MVWMQKGIAIADYMLTLGHCQDTTKTWNFWRVHAKHLGSRPIPCWTKIIPNITISLNFDAYSVGNIHGAIQLIAYIH